MPIVFRTQCCQRPICAACLASNPRLARYVPCLACLGGVGAVAGSSLVRKDVHGIRKDKLGLNGGSEREREKLDVNWNLDGALRDRDVFVLGDSDEEDSPDDDGSDEGSKLPGKKPKDIMRGGNNNIDKYVMSNYDTDTDGPPPPYSGPHGLSSGDNGDDVPPRGFANAIATKALPVPPPDSRSVPDHEAGRNNLDFDTSQCGRETQGQAPPSTKNIPETQTPPPSAMAEHTETRTRTEGSSASATRKHYIQKDDSLRGLALRYGVDGRTLCRLNNLPPSTLTTTPHILHTRTVLVLPPSAKPPPSSSERHEREVVDPAREREIELEKTAKRLQLITKEVDWDVARAYAVLAQSRSSSSFSSVSDGSEIPGYDAHVEAHSDDPRTEKAPGPREPDEKTSLALNGNENENENENEKRARERRGRKATMQERALDAYLEDDAWEARERAAGRVGPSGLPRTPPLTPLGLTSTLMMTSTEMRAEKVLCRSART